MSGENYQSLDEILHSRIRLAIVSILVSAGELEFVPLRDRVGATNGNMNAHLKKLKEYGYIADKKQFVKRKPVTSYRLTPKGWDHFKKYVETLEAFLKRDAE